jgi:hypothetical protein
MAPVGEVARLVDRVAPKKDTKQKSRALSWAALLEQRENKIT